MENIDRNSLVKKLLNHSTDLDLIERVINRITSSNKHLLVEDNLYPSILVEVILENLIDEIQFSNTDLGEWLSEKDMAKLVYTSRKTVNEAISQILRQQDSENFEKLVKIEGDQFFAKRFFVENSLRRMIPKKFSKGFCHNTSGGLDYYDNNRDRYQSTDLVPYQGQFGSYPDD
ncbi:MAG TPA: hypothetical protein PLE28_01430 [bacterium]|nr:hypothetical protein [bacterium]